MRWIFATVAVGALLLALVAILRPPEARQPDMVCRPSDPARAVQASAAVPILYLGNSLVFDHDWQIAGSIAINCARQGARATDIPVDDLPQVLPRIIVLGVGTIEILQAVPVEQAAQEIETLLQRLRSRFPDARLVLLAAPVTEGVDGGAVRALNERTARMAEETEITFLAITLPERGSYDGVHLTPAAYAPWTDAIRAIAAGLPR